MSISISGNGSITGVLTSYTFDKSVSVGGTLTYEDVTNVDSVGIITAQSGVVIGTGTSIGNPTTNELGLYTNSSERIRIDSSGRLLVGTSSALTNNYWTQGQFQVANDNGAVIQAYTFENTSSINGAAIELHRARGTQASPSNPSDDDLLGEINFYGYNSSAGTPFQRAAAIRAFVDGTPGDSATDMPGRLVFSTTADSASSPTERMRIDNSGNVILKPTNVASVSGSYSNFLGFRVTQTNGQSALLGIIRAQGQSAWGGDLVFFTKPANSTPNDSVTERLRISSSGKFTAPTIYSLTTTGGGPVYVEADGDLLRYTSSRKYKTDIETLEDKRADAILNCRPVWYRSLSPNDIKTEGAEKSDWGWYGFIAEEVAEVEPRLVNWATKDAVVQEDGSVQSVERDPADYEAEGVRYDNFVPLLLNLVKRQKEQIEAMEARLSALEAS